MQTKLTHAALQEKMIHFRHHLHEYPELADHEYATTRYIKEILQSWGIKILPTTLKTGVIAEIGNNAKGPTIALRADIDALPITEQTGLPYESRNKGVMHACGHDIHTASLLGAAYLLKQEEQQLRGSIRLIFQLSEEANEGALQVIRAGHLKGVAAIIGFHNEPGISLGKIGIRSGAFMGAIDKFKVTLRGKGSHAAHPEAGHDPIIALTTTVNALQSIISRNLSPLSGAVVSVTQLNAGNVWNVLPETAVFSGTVRTLGATDRKMIHQRFSEIVTHTAAAYGTTAEIDWYSGDPSVNNDRRLSEIVADETGKFATVFIPEPTLGSDDFACYQEHIPGVYAIIGVNGNVSVHNAHYTADDGVLIYGARYFERNAVRILQKLENESVR
ncbi:amidohydrolase [Sporolactobacillus pectinivorans]|uniref:amidohydrolase n=1 Tax=Sporolactobacillus pectinivorans TaxID=1591408 RepID=UPI000C268625|nr:amidohydrolase [Sporolactobacillus pectinivorans]